MLGILHGLLGLIVSEIYSVDIILLFIIPMKKLRLRKMKIFLNSDLSHSRNYIFHYFSLLDAEIQISTMG